MFKKLIYIILIIGLAPIIFTSSCSAIEDITGELARICRLTTYTVTKTEDTYDAICTADDCSLREAISTANDCAGPHTIELPAGTYVISITGRNEDGSVRGDFDITDDLTINGSGNPIVRASGYDRVFDVFSPATVVINGIYITGGYSSGGGGLRNHTNLTLNNVQIYENRGSLRYRGGGGGIFNDAGMLTLNNVAIFQNSANNGGGLYNSAMGVVDLLSTNFIENRAVSGGGAILNLGTAELRAAQIRDNRASFGGGIFNGHDGDLTAAATTFESNSATERGGGLSNEGDANVHHSLFTNNSAAFEGGAILNGFSATLELSNVTLSRNIVDSATASAFSGSALSSVSVASLNFVTVTDNIGPSTGSAVLSVTDSPTATAEIIINNSIIANNVGSDCNIPTTSSFSTENLDSDGSCSGFTITADPLLAPLGDNGGATFTHALLPDSPAIDAASGSCVRDDQRSVTRPQGAACDLGAYESSFESSSLEGGDFIPPTAKKDTLCLWGPGPEYGTVNAVKAGTEVILLGIGETKGWLVVETPVFPGVACWAHQDDFDLDPDIDLSLVPVFPVPPLPDEVPDDEDGGEPTTKPAAPTNLVPTPACGQPNEVKLSWTDNSNNEIGFRIYRNGNLIAVVPANTTVYVDENLQPGVYNYAVEAFNSAGVSPQTTTKTTCP